MAHQIKLHKFIACLLMVILVASIDILCGGKGKGDDIILYKNNLLIRGGKGKGKGGNLLIADSHHHGHHEGHGHHGHEDHGGHHHHIEQVLMSSKGKGKGKGGGYAVTSGGGGKKSKGEISWEDLVMGGGKY